MTTSIAEYGAAACASVRRCELEVALWGEAELDRRRLELILRSMAEALLITDARGGITLLNQSAQLLFSQEEIDFKPEVPLRKLAELNHHLWLTQLSEVVDEALGGATVISKELVLGESG